RRRDLGPSAAPPHARCREGVVRDNLGADRQAAERSPAANRVRVPREDRRPVQHRAFDDASVQTAEEVVMSRLIRTVAVVALLAGSLVPSASAVVWKTYWNELQLFADGSGSVRVYVRKIEIRPKAWKAWVGLTNRSAKKITLMSREERQG